MEQWFNLLRSPSSSLNVINQERVYHSFYQFVYRDIEFVVRDPSLVEDIIHDAFLKAILKGPEIRCNSNIPAWIKQITRNTAFDYLRKLKRESQPLIEPLFFIKETTVAEISVAKAVEIRERDQLLYQTINKLKPDHQKVLLLFYIEGKSYNEICQELDLTVTVLTQRLARARKKLYKLLIENEEGQSIF